jgi:hypothetical protein
MHRSRASRNGAAAAPSSSIANRSSGSTGLQPS